MSGMAEPRGGNGSGGSPRRPRLLPSLPHILIFVSVYLSLSLLLDFLTGERTNPWRVGSGMAGGFLGVLIALRWQAARSRAGGKDPP